MNLTLAMGHLARPSGWDGPDGELTMALSSVKYGHHLLPTVEGSVSLKNWR
jgi:hypothetical protein